MRIHTFKNLPVLLITLLSIGVAQLSYAQSPRKNDIIVKRDSTQIQALITQMSYEKINYRDLGTADSAATYIYLDKVSRVLLKNGKTINVRDSIQPGKVPTDSVGQYADLNNLPTDPFEKSIVMANSDQLRDKYEYHHNKSVDGKTGAIVFTSIAVATLVSGVIVTAVGEDSDDKKFGGALAIAGPAFGIVFGSLSFNKYRVHKKKADKVKNELERRGQSLTTFKLSPKFDPLNKSGQLTLRMTF
ncbi:hypothetical protein [Dyadobacter sp. CY343]|uniref:hypothetical protein n=1 Tax=Dyadobacter sp. CY343 TaxID=2907299 RepID=UPI001F1BD14C|nr:hypothetical protein [Dyadobacter sp. CY343]MCE7063090.1 hypothetical protein [Dyadobacter sp. CY343]